jgi:uncharacterized membrane protein YkoI
MLRIAGSIWVMKSHRSWRTLFTVLALALSIAPGARAQGKVHHTPKVSLTEARTKALAVVGGTVLAEELEQEGGRWIYSFEIKPKGETRKIVREVNIDADTGAIVNVETETG